MNALDGTGGHFAGDADARLTVALTQFHVALGRARNLLVVSVADGIRTRYKQRVLATERDISLAEWLIEAGRLENTFDLAKCGIVQSWDLAHEVVERVMMLTSTTDFQLAWWFERALVEELSVAGEVSIWTSEELRRRVPDDPKSRERFRSLEFIRIRRR